MQKVPIKEIGNIFA